VRPSTDCAPGGHCFALPLKSASDARLTAGFYPPARLPSPMTWAALFERAEGVDVDEAAVRAALVERRAATDDDGEDGDG